MFDLASLRISKISARQILFFSRYDGPCYFQFDHFRHSQDTQCTVVDPLTRLKGRTLLLALVAKQLFLFFCHNINVSGTSDILNVTEKPVFSI